MSITKMMMLRWMSNKTTKDMKFINFFPRCVRWLARQNIAYNFLANLSQVWGGTHLRIIDPTFQGFLEEPFNSRTSFYLEALPCFTFTLWGSSSKGLILARGGDWWDISLCALDGPSLTLRCLPPERRGPWWTYVCKRTYDVDIRRGGLIYFYVPRGALRYLYRPLKSLFPSRVFLEVLSFVQLTSLSWPNYFCWFEEVTQGASGQSDYLITPLRTLE